MKSTQGARRIFWMVRLLGALGLIIVALVITQIGFQLKSIRASRAHLQRARAFEANVTRRVPERCGSS